ncbi:hypothetical protein AMBR_FBHANALA_00462 [Dolosigranulum pigrum]|jgi:hypothetical protein|nr:hypothetical protein AMBR_FBHANALA_00462 [Dolosigranulum pigrum]
MNIFEGSFGVWLPMIITLVGYLLKFVGLYLAIYFGVKHGLKASKEKASSSTDFK